MVSQPFTTTLKVLLVSMVLMLGSVDAFGQTKEYMDSMRNETLEQLSEVLQDSAMREEFKHQIQQMLKISIVLESFAVTYGTIVNDFDSVYDACRLEDAFYEERLAADVNFTRTPKIFRTLRTALGERKRRFDSLFTSADTTFVKLNVTDEYKKSYQAILDKFNRTLMPLEDSISTIRAQRFDVLERRALLFHRERANWHAEDDKIVFDDDSTQLRLNVLTDEYEALIDREGILVDKLNDAFNSLRPKKKKIQKKNGVEG